MGTGKPQRPSRFVRFVLRLVVDETELEELDELFAHRVVRDGLRNARRGYRLDLWWGLKGFVSSRWSQRRSGGQAGSRWLVDAGLLCDLVSDLRIACRRLRKSPGFTVAAVAVLTLGIGASATAYGAFRMAVLTPPPFPDPERLVTVDLKRSRDGQESMMPWPYPQYFLLENWEGRLVDPIASYKAVTATLTEVGPASLVQFEIVSPGFFDLLGLSPVLGRAFLPAEGDIHGEYRVAVIGFDFWRNRMGGDPNVLARQVRLNGEVFHVVGVAPEGFRGLADEVQLWVPFGATEFFIPGRLEQWYNHMVRVVGRLTPNASLSAAAAQMDAVGEAVAEAFPRVNYSVGINSLTDVWKNDGAQTAVKLFALAAGMLLLVACANLSGLLVARSRRVIRDSAVRLALGASRMRLFRSALSESLLIALLGGMGSVLFSKWATAVVIRVWPAEFSANDEAGLVVVDPGTLALDGGTLAFAFALVLVTAIFIGLLPAFRASITDAAIHLKAGSGAGRRARSRSGVDAHALLVGIQVALALTLLIGAGLVGTSVKKLLGVDDGFRTENLLTFDYTLPEGYDEVDIVSTDLDEWVTRTAAAVSFDGLLLERLAALPGVEGATTGCKLLQSGICAQTPISAIEGRPDYEPNSEGTGIVSVGDDYFDVMGIPLLQGRVFTRNDGLAGESVVILSELAVARFFPDGNPIGRRLGPGFAPPGRQMARVIGVVGDVRHNRADDEPVPVVYFSNRERRFTSHAIVRTTVDPKGVIGLVREVVAALDPSVALSSIETADEIVSRGVGYRRLILGLLAAFAAVTILLAAVGTWGVVANAVTNQRRELGIRLALGARHDRVVRLVIRRSMTAGALGVLIGFFVAWLGGGVLGAYLWQTDARDPATFAGAGAFLLAVVFLASYLPARHATRINPVLTLNTE